MAMRQWMIYVGMLFVSTLFCAAGCSKAPPAPPPPGVTKEMEQTAPPTIEFSPPSATEPPSTPPAKPATAAKPAK
jgi:hypothetical protein